MDNFGKSQLLKYGWSEGKGLGKNENGMVQAIKPKLKFDTAGIGHTESNDYQWWKFVFNKAANNVDVIPQSCDISFKRKNESIEINTKAKSSDGLKGNLLYGNFIKTCKLENGKLIQNKDSRSFIAPTNETQLNQDPFVPDDDVLFNVCGGRTAHKGARHGIKQSGKLARIEKQEQELADKILSLEVLDDDWIKVKKKNKKYRSRDMDTDNDNNIVRSQNETMQLSDSLEINPDDDEKSDHCVSKKVKRKNKRRIENLTHQLEAALDFSEVIKIKKSKRKSNNKNSDSDVEVNRKKKKLKKNKSSDGDVEVCEENFISEVNSALSVDSNKSISGDMIKSIVKKSKKKNILSASVLNNKIVKKKKQKFSKKEERKMKFLSESLNELILDQNTLTFDKDNIIKKKKKKKKSIK